MIIIAECMRQCLIIYIEFRNKETEMLHSSTVSKSFLIINNKNICSIFKAHFGKRLHNILHKTVLQSKHNMIVIVR